MNTDQTPKQVVNKQYESMVTNIESYIEKRDYERTEEKFLRQLESLEQVIRELKEKEYQRIKKSSSPRETHGMNPQLNDILQVVLCFMIGSLIVQIFLALG